MEPKRNRYKLNITLSPEARRMLNELAESKGLPLARQIEVMTRETYEAREMAKARAS